MRTNLQLKSILVRFLPASAIAVCLSISLFAATVQMEFVGVNGTEAFGDYVGPYSGTMNGAPVDLFCVDFANEVTSGQHWDANLTAITSGADLSDTRYDTIPGALDLYPQATWLTLQFTSQPTSQYGDIQATIWQLFNSAAPSPSSSRWLERARGNYSTVEYADYRIITNTGPVQLSGQIQEFLTRIQSTDAPEPNMQLLIGLALVAVSYVSRRIRRAHQHTGSVTVEHLCVR